MTESAKRGILCSRRAIDNAMIQNICQLAVVVLGRLSFLTIGIASFAGFLAGQQCRRDRGADDGKEL